MLLTAMIGQFAYALAAEKPAFLLLGFLAAVFSWSLVSAQLRGSPKPVWRPLLNALVILAILNLVYQILRADRQEPITSLTDFLSYVMLVKMLDRPRIRDEAQLLGLSLFVVIGSLLTGQSLGLGLMLLFYTPLAIWSAIQIQLFSGRERSQYRYRAANLAAEATEFDERMSRNRTGRSLLIMSATCIGLSLGAGLIAFLITPRQLAQQLGGVGGALKQSPTTGFSDSLQLGNAGLISENHQAVMDMTLTDPVTGKPPLTSGTVYLRGATLDTYDPRTGRWSGVSSSAKDNREDARRASVDNLLGDRFELSSTRTLRRLMRYDIIQRNTRNGRVPLFAPLQIVNAKVEGGRGLEYYRADSTLHAGSMGGRMAYTIVSTPDYINPEVSPITAPKMQEFSPRIRALARDILDNGGIEPLRFQSDPSEIRRAANLMVAHLARFSYTLEMLAPPEGQDPIEMFLLDRQAGHCEYFASGMTALLESIDIPARVVTGYVAAEYNSVSGHYTIRQSDAHAWVEVQTSPGRWETFDPTPPGELQSSRRRQGGLFGWAKEVWDAVEFSWLDNVVAYDRGLKFDLSAAGPRGSMALYEWQLKLRDLNDKLKAKLPGDALTRSLILGVIVFAIVLLVFGGYRLLRRVLAPLIRGVISTLWFGRSARRSDPNITEHTRFYYEALDALDAAKVTKPDATPPLTYAQESLPAHDNASAEQFEQIARSYYAIRFGGHHPTPEEASASSNAVGVLSDSLRAAAERR